VKDILIQLFTDAARGTPSRDTIKIVDGCWQMTSKSNNKEKWGKTCALAGVPADAEQIISGDALIVRWPSYADMIFGADGLMAKALPNYEMRPGQLHMARLVQRAIEMGEPFVCEAGTGIGKSFAYAAICMAMNKKVIIATSNKALQMQLYNKDIPFLQTLFPGKKMALAQGKSNYVCWENCKAGVSDQRFADWIQTTKTGSIEELTFDYQDASKYTVDDECTGKRCDFYAQCFYFQQKALRNDADVIICNHSLLALNHHFQNAQILPAADVVVVDEAHQLPNYVRNAIGWEYYAGMVRKALGRVYDRDSVYVGTAENLLLDLESEVVKYSSKFGDKQITIPDDMTFDSGIALADELYAIATAVWPMDGDVVNKDERKKERRAKALRNLASNLTDLCVGTEKGHVRWIDTDTPKITNVPFDVSAFIRSMVEHTFELSDDRDLEDDYSDDEPATQGKPVYILASATLATPALAGFKRECGITHGFELIAQSPFDYANNALLYVPNGGTPPPNQPDFLQYLVDEVRGLVMSSGGGVFLLFTSWANMKHCSDALRQEFAKHFPVYVQGELPKLEIARRFKTDGNAVLFATKSFWEGVDIPGDALRCVIIDKMPFAAPSPLFKAREKTSSNPFVDIALPEMIIDLKQGVGRLVRRATDRGVIAILDSRIRSKPYGRNIVLKSLPPAKLIHSTAMITEFFADGRKASFPDLTNITVSHSAEPTEDFTLVF
jgi:ATP-dependent DNA helicase DinG